MYCDVDGRIRTVTSAALIMYYIFLYNQSAVAFDEFDKAKRAYRDKKIEDKPDQIRIGQCGDFGGESPVSV